MVLDIRGFAGSVSFGCGRAGSGGAPGVECAGRELRHHLRVPTLRIAQDDAADELLSRDPLALLIGMLLDQHLGSGAYGLRR